MKRRRLIVVLTIICVAICGCGNLQETDGRSSSNEAAFVNGEENKNLQETLEKICDASYEEDSETGFSVKETVARLGEAGYVAVDLDNKMDMVCPDKLLDFIKKQEAGENAEIRVFQVTYDKRLFEYDLSTGEGKVFARINPYRFDNHHLEDGGSCEFEVVTFEYTDEGYLMIGGSWLSPEMYAISLGEEKEHIALRVEPLDEKCRELCEKYIAPVSYEMNNMFLTDWSGEDFGDLDLYDVFEKFYKETYGEDFPYRLENTTSETVFPVAGDEFEKVVLAHVPITQQELQERVPFDPNTNCYTYRPRYFYEFDYCDVPYPEVISYKDNADGSITLQVNGVYPQDNTSKLFVHSVTVKEVDGKTCYLSNQMLEGADGNFWWHGQRRMP